MIPDELIDRVRSILNSHHHQAGALLPVLHDVQAEFNYVPSEAVSEIANTLKLSRAEVHGVLTYYHHFRQTPPGKHVVRVCRAEACQAQGGDALVAHAERRLAQSSLTLEPVYCLGLCAIGPSIQVDEINLHAQVTPGKFDALIADLEGTP